MTLESVLPLTKKDVQYLVPPSPPAGKHRFPPAPLSGDIESIGPRFRWKWSHCQLPVGSFSVGVSEKRRPTTTEWQTTKTVELTLSLPPWLAKNIVKASFAVESSKFGGPGFKWHLSQVYRNDNPILADAVRGCQLSTLQHLFSMGLARPTDVVGQWGDSLLHVSVILARR
jgi:hypothetical protein